MKIWLIITISALKAVAMMRKYYLSRKATEHRDIYVPTQVQAPAESLAEVIDFISARNRILDKRALSLGVV